MAPVSVSPRSAARIVVAALAFGTTLAAQARLGGSTPATQSGALVPEPGAARVAALGFDSLLSDFYWLRAVQIIGDERARSRANAALIGRLVSVVAGLDPWVDHPYRFAAIWISDVPESLPTADRLLERGIAYHPLDWRNRFYLSFNHLFYEGDAPAAARELEPAVDLDGAPLYLGRLLARLRAQGGDLDASAGYLAALAQNAPDEWHKAEYEKALDEIETERRARFLDRAREVYRQRNGGDIARVQDLVSGRDAVLGQLPPEPHGSEWMIDPDDGRIVSRFYGHRYEVNVRDRRTAAAGSFHEGRRTAAGLHGRGAR